MKKVYISGPYSAPSEFEVSQNILAARTEAALWWKAGAAVFCPHLNSAFFGGLVPQEAFYEADLLFLDGCDRLVLLPGWESSVGCQKERAHANALSIPVWIRYKNCQVWRTEAGELYDLGRLEQSLRKGANG